MTIKAFAPAKINLALHVTGQRTDGFHLLDSLVCFADVGDVVRAEAADTLSLRVTGPMAAGLSGGEDNLILKAARLLGNGRGAEITLEKNLPIAAGIGGGSADAAATLQVLTRLWGCDMPAISELTKLGADVPVCVQGDVARMSGIGDKIVAVERFPALFGVLVNPGVTVATADVFKGLVAKDNPALKELPHEAGDWVSYLRQQRNDLQEPALRHAPVIGDVLRAIESVTGCELARMSGSGATCFGLFADFMAARRARDVLVAGHPKWWVRAVRFGASGGDI